ncbi:nucleoside monophosphate kinase [Candidatus Bathyarchaeota archaeon]|nr:nucleoside monophosphate kinase [Candidatus Bathyarchaeota archaeon]
MVNSGKLVPDRIAVDIVRSHLEKPQCQDRFVMDGFPRVIRQARFLNEYLNSKGTHLDRMILLDILEKEVFRRAVARRIEDGRKDDESDKTLSSIMKTYQNQTMQAIKYFEAQGTASHIDGTLTIPPGFENILFLLSQNMDR